MSVLPKPMTERVSAWVVSRQNSICQALERLQGAAVERHPWTVERGRGGGVAGVLREGVVFEKGGVNISTIEGDVFPEMAKMLGLSETLGYTFFASGISLVLHPKNPFVPTVHANYRYFEICQEDRCVRSFFGGGTDLTPYYLFEEDAVHFHQVQKVACDVVDGSWYAQQKLACDRYFYLPHRKEYRGIGGIFSLRLDVDQEQGFSWIDSCGRAFTESYVPIVQRRRTLDFGGRERRWQCLRRGRYVEFNLLYDAGTEFGLKQGENRAENILMSLPPTVAWDYCPKIEEGSREAHLMEVIRTPVAWLQS